MLLEGEPGIGKSRVAEELTTGGDTPGADRRLEPLLRGSRRAGVLDLDRSPARAARPHRSRRVPGGARGRRRRSRPDRSRDQGAVRRHRSAGGPRSEGGAVPDLPGGHRDVAPALADAADRRRRRRSALGRLVVDGRVRARHGGGGRAPSAGGRDVPQRRSDLQPRDDGPAPRLSTRAKVRRLQLQGLEADELAQFLRAAGATPTDELLATMEERTRGNPFFITEILRLVPGDSGAPDARMIEHVVPSNIKEVVLRRVNRLPDATSQTLLAASVLGHEFDIGLLASIADVDEATVARPLGTGADRRIADREPRPGGSVPVLARPRSRGDVRGHGHRPARSHAPPGG